VIDEGSLLKPDTPGIREPQLDHGSITARTL
jgi:hypothetical protein